MSKEHTGIGSYTGRCTDYRDGYCSDDEIYVYDQCCGNCALHGSEACPLYIDEYEQDTAVIRAKKEMCKEDAIFRDGESQWCIHWEQRSHRKSQYGGGNEGGCQ